MSERHLEEGTLLWEPTPAAKAATNLVALPRLARARTRPPLRRLRRPVALVGRRSRGVLVVDRRLLRDPDSGATAPRARARRRCPGRPGSRAASSTTRRSSSPHAAARPSGAARSSRSAIRFARCRGRSWRPRWRPWRPACGGSGSVAAIGSWRSCPNIPEAVIALLACASLGAIWASCSPDFGTQSLIDRFAQIEPKVLIAVDGYTYGGKPFDRRAVIDEMRAAAARRSNTPSSSRTWTRRPPPDPARRPGSELVGGPAGAAPVRVGAVRPSALGALLVGHDRAAEGDRPRPRRDRPRAHQGARPPLRHPRRRSHVLVHDDRLDDVELPARVAAGRRDAGAVRRQPGLPGPRRSCGRWRRRRRSACSGRAPRSSRRA